MAKLYVYEPAACEAKIERRNIIFYCMKKSIKEDILLVNIKFTKEKKKREIEEENNMGIISMSASE